jgi:hypothetical protein
MSSTFYYFFLALKTYLVHGGLSRQSSDFVRRYGWMMNIPSRSTFFFKLWSSFCLDDPLRVNSDSAPFCRCTYLSGSKIILSFVSNFSSWCASRVLRLHRLKTLLLFVLLRKKGKILKCSFVCTQEYHLQGFIILCQEQRSENFICCNVEEQTITGMKCRYSTE